MKLSTRDKNLIVFVVCAAIIVLAYVFGYQKINDKSEETETEITRLETRKKDLEAQLLKKDYYEENIVTKTLEYNKLLAEYPEGINQENQYQFLIQLMTSLGINDSDGEYTISKANKVYDFPDVAAYDDDLSGISSDLKLTFKTTYDQFKAFLKYIESCDNTSTMLLLADGTTYEQKWPIHKTFLTSVGVEQKQSVVNEELETSLICYVTMKQLAVTSENRIYLNPTIVDIPGYQPPLSKKDIFEAEPEEPGETDTQKELISRVKATYDAKIDVEAGMATMYMKGEKGTLAGVGSSDKDLYITLEEGGSAGLYFLTYSFGEDAYAAENKAGIAYKRMAFMPQDNIDLLVVSEARYEQDAFKLKEDGTEGEKVKIKMTQEKLNIHINNTTDKQINLVIIGQPAEALEETNDKYKVNVSDGLAYINADTSLMTGKVEILSVLDEDVKALSLLVQEQPAA